MTPHDFVGKWGPGGPAWTLNERQGAQPHVIDLCAVLGVAPPDDAGRYCFEKGATRIGAHRGFADGWKRGCFAWEYMAPPARPDRPNDTAPDEAVAAACGYTDWTPALPDDEIVRRLLALNRARSSDRPGTATRVTPAPDTTPAPG